MSVQPITWILGGLAFGGVTLAGVQTSEFAAQPSASAMTAMPSTLPATGFQPDSAQSFHIDRSKDGLFYVDGMLQGVPVRFAIDTGASVVVLNMADARRAGLGDGQSSARIRTASGYGKMAWHRAQHLTVAGRPVGQLDIAVMEDGPETSLLGLNALSRLKSVTLKQDRLIIE
ncbi:retropepsin-like aspartic protease [Parasphingorhabdus sp.]|uniref:retropepsin-like aspartic protease family protein n=1 Tax=Parasphingorhabdus sp. TaxID=2709688 RepID=UPI003262FAC1